MNKVPKKVWKRSNFVLEKSGKLQSDFCTNPVCICYISDKLTACTPTVWP